MKFTIITNLYALFFSFFFLFVQAAPIPNDIDARDVFIPKISYPTANTVWKSGETRYVQWDVTHPPKQITNGKGRVMLRQGDRTTPFILAADFDILLGRVKVTVPLVLDGNDYSVVVFGDSGNFSPKFTILSGYPY